MRVKTLDTYLKNSYLFFVNTKRIIYGTLISVSLLLCSHFIWKLEIYLVSLFMLL